MKNKKTALSLIEAMVVLVIVVVGLVGVYSVFVRSVRTTVNLENKIQAIQIAREGIEAMQNIRDTNWLLFPLDKKNCWNTKNYNIKCLGNNSMVNKIQNNKSHKIFRDPDGRRLIEEGPNGSYYDINYRDFYKVGLDSNGLYTQNGGTDLNNQYTREIITTYTDAIAGKINTAINVKSIVRWSDSSSNKYNEVVLDLVLTNYKK